MSTNLSHLPQLLDELEQHFTAHDNRNPPTALDLPHQHWRLAERFGLAWSAENNCWEKVRTPRWRVKCATLAQDEPGWRALFASAFGYAMPRRQFLWKYAHAALMGVAVFRDQSMVAFYGGMPRAIHYFGQKQMAVQIGDVMVDPAERGILTKKGPFQMAAATFLEYLIGDDKPYLLGFGFPEHQALKLAMRLGLYAPVDQMVELSWPSERQRWDICFSIHPVKESDATVVDKLWDAMASAFGQSIIGVRNWAYVKHRYLSHPMTAYHVLMVRRRWLEKPLALIVLRDRPEEDALELVDMITQPRHFPTVVHSARHFASVQRRKKLFTWLTQSHAWHLAEIANAAIRPLDIMIPTNIWSPGPSPSILCNRWWLMAGDTDFR